MNKVLLRPLFKDAYLKKEKKLEVKKFNVGGFSKIEKRNLLLTPITSALLQARKAPGEGELGAVFRSIGKGLESLPSTQLAIKKMDMAAAEAAADRKEKKIASSKKVLDSDTGNIVFKTEEDIQTTMSTKSPDKMRFVPVPDAQKAQKPMKVYDTVTEREVFALPSQVMTAFKDDGKTPRFVPVGNVDQVIKAYKIDAASGEAIPKPIFVSKKEVLANPELYQPVEGNIEMMLKVDDLKLDKKAKQDAKNQMLAADDVARIIRRLEKDIIDGGAFTGAAADLVGNISGLTGFLDQFINKQSDTDTTLFKQQYRDAQEAIEVLLKDDTYNARLTRFLNAPESQAAKTSIVNLAYAIAKAREPGGRFSVPDIELALRSIGESSNKATFLAGLKRTGLEATERAIKDYEKVFNVTREDLPIKYKELIDNYGYFGGFEVKDDEDLDPKKLPL